MTERIASLFHGQHAFSTTVVIIFVTATTFYALGKMSEPGWIDMTKWVFGVFVGGGAAAAYRDAFARRDGAA